MKSSKHIFAFVWFVITILECSIPEVADSVSQNFNMVSWIVVINLIFQTLTMVILKMPLTSFFYAFVVFYYLFHFGQIFMLGLFPEYELEYLNYVKYYMTNDDILNATVRLCLVSINAFFIGGISVTDSNRKKLTEPRVNIDKIIKKIFYILMPFRIMIDIVQIAAAMIFGYYGAIKATNMIPGVIASAGNMWYALVPLFYLSFKKEKTKQKFLIFILVYMALTMLTGNRGHQIVCLSSLLLVILISKKNITFQIVAKYTIVIIAGLFFIDIVYEMRETSISKFLADPLSFTKSSQKSNIILETIGTFGETIYTPYLVLEGSDSIYHTWFGEAFVKSLAGVIPDVFGVLKDINKESLFPKNLGTESAIGGSFSGEMYYNFGNLYPILSLIIGYFYCKLSNYTYYSIKNKNYQDAFMPIVICSLTLWWVRDSIGNLTRQIVWMYWLYLLFKPKVKYI